MRKLSQERAYSQRLPLREELLRRLIGDDPPGFHEDNPIGAASRKP
jgi:hypothetical protein